MFTTSIDKDVYHVNSTTNTPDNGASASTTTFPAIDEILAEELQLCLINSDAQECNQNLSTYIKTVVDLIGLRSSDSNYHQLSLYAMRLITSNLFIKNYQLCLGKMLGLFTVFTNVKSYEVETGETCTSEKDVIMKEFLCIVMFLLLKLKNTEDDEPDLLNFNHCVDTNELFDTLRSYKFVTIIANFIVKHVEHTDTSFILLKFSCDIIFEYLYHVELLSDAEFDNLVSQGTLIQTLIKDLLENNSFHDYDINDSEWQNEEKLIAYEEFKLLLLLNEQYLMKSYTCPDKGNKIFDSLMGENLEESTDSINSRISGFMNLLVFHINREESHIIKILILKFLYLIFTSSYTSKLYYLNDLKILVDIFVRELNDVEYMQETNAENRILVLTYLKVMYPMMMFSQLCELTDAYKKDEIMYMLSHIISNVSAIKDNNSNISAGSARQLQQISELAQKCMSVTWLKKKKRPELHQYQSNSSSSSLNSNTIRPNYDERSSSNDSIANSFTRVASVRASNRTDYHLNTTKHNAGHEDAVEGMALENNNNVFLNFQKLNINGSDNSIRNHLQRRRSNILDLPHEYLDKQKPPSNQVPQVRVDGTTSDKSALMKKASRKKAPPPPSPKHRTPPNTPQFQRAAHSLSPAPYESPTVRRSAYTPEPVPVHRSGPPPPPPRRRR